MPVKKIVKKSPAKKKTPSKDYIPKTAATKKPLSKTSSSSKVSKASKASNTSKTSASKSDFTFTEVLSQTWTQYQTNFKEIFKFQLFLILPLFLILLHKIYWIFSNENIAFAFSTSLGDKTVLTGLLFPETYLTISVLLTILYFMVYLFIAAGLYVTLAKNSQLSFEAFLANAKANWARYILIAFLITISLLLLFLAFIIPGIIFMVYWSFAIYIYFEKGTTKMEALSQSKELVTGNWWKVFGYTILVTLIFIITAIVLQIILTFIGSNISPSIGAEYIASTLMLWEFLEGLLNILMIPFSILFYRNFYFKMRK